MPSPPDPLLRTRLSPLFSFALQMSPRHLAERFHVFQRGTDFYLRLENHPDWLAIVASDERLQRLTTFRSDNEILRDHLREKIANREWGRVISLSDPKGQDELWRVLWKGKRSFLMRASTNESVDFRSDGEWTKGAWIQVGTHFAKRFAREWNNPTSDVRTARDFLKANGATRRLWGLEWIQGSWQQMNPVLRAAAIIEHQWGDRVFVQSRTIDFQTTTFTSNAPQSGRLLRLVERLQERNVVIMCDKSKLRRLAPHPFNFEFGVARWPELRIEIDSPSEHEKLEARLELRDWLREEAPDLAGEWEQ